MKLLRAVLLGAAICTLASVLPASAGTTTAFQSAKEVTLPSGALGIPQGYLPVLSCVSAGNCVAGGDYTNASGNENGLILNEANGTWSAPITLEAPTGAATAPNLMIYGLSCSSVGNCAAVGNYQDSAGDGQAFVANEVAKSWGRAEEVALPSNALSAGQDAIVHSVVCSSNKNCSAVGSYFDDSAAPFSLGFDLSEVNGTWKSAQEISFTSSTNVNPFVTISQIACTSTGNCTGVGSYIDANGVNQGFFVDQVNGVWSPGEAVTLPANASAYAGASLSEVACAKGACTVLGTYLTNTGALEALSASNVGGAWARASELTMPAGAAVNPHAYLYGFLGISCANAQNCAAGGQYRDASGNYQGFLVSEVNGTWTSAVELPLPTGAMSAGANGGVVSLTCPKAGDCRAGAAYLDASSNYQALTVTEVGGTWQSGAKVTLPGGASTVGVDGGIYAMVCSSVNACTAIGSYLKNTTIYDGFTLNT
jgi:hypothetical protein